MLSTNQSNNFGISCEHFKPSTPESVIHHHHLANACAHFGHKAGRTTRLQRGKAGLTMNSFSSRLSRLSSTLSSNAVRIGSRLDSAISDGLASARYALMREREYWRLSSAARRTHSSQPQRASCGRGTASPRSSRTLTIS